MYVPVCLHQIIKLTKVKLVCLAWLVLCTKYSKHNNQSL